jgi:hypothetical protein
MLAMAVTPIIPRVENLLDILSTAFDNPDNDFSDPEKFNPCLRLSIDFILVCTPFSNCLLSNRISTIRSSTLLAII